MAEPESMIAPMLRDIRADMNKRFDEIGRQFGKVGERFDRLEKGLESVRQAGVGESVLGRYAAAEVEDRHSGRSRSACPRLRARSRRVRVDRNES